MAPWPRHTLRSINSAAQSPGVSRGLTTTAANLFSSDQIGAFSTTQMRGLTTTQLKALSTGALDAVDVS